MTASTNNPFQNYSGPSGLNRGGNGKFTPSQTIERTKLHAISLALGTPTLAQIIGIWKERFSIDITIPSEKEWRASNRDAIEKKKLELVESGEIKIPVISEEVLSDNLLNNTIATGRLLQDTRVKAIAALKLIKIEASIPSNELKQRLEVFDQLTKALSRLNKDFVDQTGQLFSMSGKLNIKDKKIKELVDRRFDEKLSENQDEDEGANPMEFEVTDAMRETLNPS